MASSHTHAKDPQDMTDEELVETIRNSDLELATVADELETLLELYDDVPGGDSS